MAKKAEVKNNAKKVKSKSTKTVDKKIQQKNNIKETKKIDKKNDQKLNKEIKKNMIAKSNSDELTKLIQLILIVSVILVIFYLITTWVTDNKRPNNSNEEETVQDTIIQYDEILIGNLLAQPNDEYYALVIAEDDADATSYNTLINTYRDKENSLRVYSSKLDSVFNNKYKSDESYFDTEKISEVKFKMSTLVKVQNKKVVEQYEGSSDIVDAIESIME